MEWQWLTGLGIWLIEISYIPQLLRLYRIKHADDFSLFFPLFNLAGRSLAFVYTITRGDYVLAWGFLGGIALRSMLLGMVIYYKKNGKALSKAKEDKPAETVLPQLQPAPVLQVASKSRIFSSHFEVLKDFPLNSQQSYFMDKKQNNSFACSPRYIIVCAADKCHASPKS